MASVETPVSPSRGRALRRSLRRRRYLQRQFPVPSRVDVHIGKRLRLLRSAIGFSREVLAAGVGLAVDRVEAHERGTKRMGAHHLAKYAQFLGVRLSAFFK